MVSVSKAKANLKPSSHPHGATKALAANADSTPKPKFLGECFACGKKGHIAHYCPSKKTDHAAATAETNKAGAAIYHACAAHELNPAPDYNSSPCFFSMGRPIEVCDTVLSSHQWRYRRIANEWVPGFSIGYSSST